MDIFESEFADVIADAVQHAILDAMPAREATLAVIYNAVYDAQIAALGVKRSMVARATTLAVQSAGTIRAAMYATRAGPKSCRTSRTVEATSFEDCCRS